MSEALGLIGIVVGIIIQFVIERIREKSTIKRCRKEKTESAKILAKEFLQIEIEKNNKQKTEIRYLSPDHSFLTAIQQGVTNINFVCGPIYFSNKNWEIIRNKVIELDIMVAVSVNKLYHYYEFLIAFEGNTSFVKETYLESFSDYDKDYNYLMDMLK